MLYWKFTSSATAAHGAIPPKPADFAYGRRSPQDMKLKGPDLQRSYILGRPVVPSDCPPIRRIARYGVVLRCPGAVVIERSLRPACERVIMRDGWSSFGPCRVSGDYWPEGDSGFVASWISGSEFVKIQVGITMYFPADANLLQMSPPNVGLLEGVPTPEVMSGLEYPNMRTAVEIRGDSYSISVPNVIVKVPAPGKQFHIGAGDVIAWMLLVPKAVHLAEL